MDGTVAGACGQSRLPVVVLDPVGDEKQGDFGSVFLIHTNKSRGPVVNPCVSMIKNQDMVSESKAGGSECLSGEAWEHEGIAGLAGRLEKYAKQTQDSAKFGRWLASRVGWKRYQAIGRRVAVCGSHLVFHDYFRRDVVKLAEANNCCTAMLCPFCAGRRAVRHLQNTVPKIKQVLLSEPGLVPYLFTITIRDEPVLVEMYRRLRGFWSKCVQMRREAKAGNRVAVWSKFYGGIMSFEVKRGSGSGLWHVHGHAVVLGLPGLEQAEFQSAWSDSVGYWAQSDLRPLSSTQLIADKPDTSEADRAIAEDLMEVFKYALKFNGMTFEDRFEAYRVLKGQRLVRAFGCLYGVKLDEQFLDDIEDLQAEPYIRLVYNAISTQSEYIYKLSYAEKITNEQCVSTEHCVTNHMNTSAQVEIGVDTVDYLDEIERLEKQFAE